MSIRNSIAFLAVTACCSMSWAQGGIGLPSDLFRVSGTNTSGCFGVCQCIITHNQSLRGTFRLTPIPSIPLVNAFEVSGVNWWLDTPTGPMPVTGHGVYTMHIFGDMHEMQLELSVNHGEPRTYESGLVPIEPSETLDITVRHEVDNCTFDEFTFSGGLVDPAHIDDYFVRNGLFITNCGDPCAPPECVSPLTGGFNMIFLRQDFLVTEFAITDAEFLTAVAFPEATTLTGNGLWHFGGDLLVTEQLVLELRSGNEPFRLFDSGTTVTNFTFPIVDQVVTHTDPRNSCIQQSLDFVATPCQADVDLDGDTDLGDLGIVLGNFGCSGAQCAGGDLDGDGEVGLGDLGVVLADYNCQSNIEFE